MIKYKLMNSHIDIEETETRTQLVLSQAIGAEFGYYLDKLTQPDSTMLIKLGGAIVASQIELVTDAVQTLTELGIYPAIIHGAGPQIDANLALRGIPEKKVAGIRVTNEETLGVVTETFINVNNTISESLRLKGVNTQPITEGIFTADYLDRDVYGFVGNVDDVNVKPVADSLFAPSVPVISCLGKTPEGQPLNVNGDTASAALAGRLMVHKFVTLSHIGGVLDQKDCIIPVLNIRSGVIERLIDDGTISDGMIPKIKEIVASVEKLSDDASAVITLPASLIRELFTHAGEGTLIRKGDEIVHYPSIRAVNHHMVRELIENSFGGKLRKDYFTNLPESAEIFTTTQTYNGVAIVIPDSTPDGEPLPAYLDKLIVRQGFQGYGIGKELIDAAISRYSTGLYWRTKTSNLKQIEWYSKIADSYMAANGWTVFTKGVTVERQADCLQKAINVEPSVIY